MKKKEPLFTVGRNVNWYNHYGKQYGYSFKILKQNYSMIQQIHFQVQIKTISKRYLQPHVQCSNIHSRQNNKHYTHLSTDKWIKMLIHMCVCVCVCEKSESRSVMSDSLQLHELYSPWNSPGQNTGVGSHSLLQGIFPTQGFNPGLSHCRRILYQLSRKGSPRILEWVAYPFSSESSRPRNQTGVSCIAGGFFLPTEL